MKEGKEEVAANYDDGWNDALEALMDRFKSAIASLDEMSEAKKGPGNGGDYDRLRGKVMGVKLAHDCARGMVRF